MFPIAEVFVAPQGEGTHTGRLMIFLRLAGCTVGTRFALGNYNRLDNPFPIYTNQCHLYDGRTFACDTDYRKKLNVSEEELIPMLKKVHATCDVICITGGEPLMHKDVFCKLTHLLANAGYKLHLETSGTIPISEDIQDALFRYEHISISPKLGFRKEYLNLECDMKFLVDENFDLDKIPFKYADTENEYDSYYGIAVWLQPVNYEHTVNEDNLKRCLDLQIMYPLLRISMQSHKLWNTR